MAARKASVRQETARLGAQAVNASLTPRQRTAKARRAARIRWAIERAKQEVLRELAS